MYWKKCKGVIAIWTNGKTVQNKRNTRPESKVIISFITVKNKNLKEGRYLWFLFLHRNAEQLP